MSKLCPKCFYIGRGKNGPLNGSFVVGAVFVLIGIYGLTNQDFLFGSYALWVATNSILIVLGIIRIVEHFIGGNLCPKCGFKPMLKVDTIQAINLIKEHDFEQPETEPKPQQNESAL